MTVFGAAKCNDEYTIVDCPFLRGSVAIKSDHFKHGTFDTKIDLIVLPLQFDRRKLRKSDLTVDI